MNEKPPIYQIDDKMFRLFIDSSQIEKRIEELANQINSDYAGKKPLFIIVLKGAIFFASDLLRKIELDCRIETVSARSYGMAMESSGNVELFFSSKIEFKGENVIIIEDIVDSGKTLNTLINHLNTQQAASIGIASLLLKPEKNKFNIYVKYLGFGIPSAFVIGYGLDYAEQGRQLPDLYSLAES